MTVPNGNIRFGDSDQDSTGAFLIGELERLDPRLYEPLADFTWSRDVPVRSDVTIVDQVTSFITTEYAGGFAGTGTGKKSWMSDGSTTLPAPKVKSHKHSTPFSVWAAEVSYTIMELKAAQMVNRPIDVQKLDAMRMKWQLDVDIQAYLGDEEVGVEGLLNSSAVTSSNIGAWSTSLTPEQVLTMFNNALNACWQATSFVRMPGKILVPPHIFGHLAGTQLPNTGSSLLQFVKANNIVAVSGGSIDIQPCKYLAPAFGFFTDTTTKLVVYTQAEDVVRLPMVELQRFVPQFRGLSQCVPYYGGIGGVEFVRPEMLYYGVFSA